MKHIWFAAVAVVCLAVAFLPLGAQPRPGTTELPVSQIVMFTSGVGYFQRDGQVDGVARIDLQFPVANINDLLKSLVVQDLGGGTISTVHYDSRNPLARTLKSFAIDLTANPSMGQLLNQVRGERVEMEYLDKTALGTLRDTKLTGVIVGVEHKKQAAGNQVVEVDQVNVLTGDGLQSVILDQVRKVRLLKPELEQEFRKALEVLAAGHDTQKKTVSLNFTGTGKRSVRVGYVTESPMWKTSYRLALEDKDKVFLQGWAIVENTTDEDWNRIRLALVSGRPVSFQMDLYEPLFVPRPIVEPEIFASLRPPTYASLLTDAEKGLPPLPGAGPPAAAESPPPPLNGKPGERPAKEPDMKFEKLEQATKSIDFRDTVVSAAQALNLGDYFQYTIEQPVTLPRQKSAMIPIVNQGVEAARVSIFNENVHEKYPLLGLRFKNATKLYLMQGPITVFDGPNYAGDARFAEDLKPGESRLVSYAIDLATEVEATPKELPDTLLTVKIAKGILHATSKERLSRIYTVVNRSEQSRKVIIEHPYRSDWKLVTPDKGVERSRDVYRMELTAEPNKPVQQEVVEEHTRTNQVLLSTSRDEAIQVFIKASQSSATVKVALEKALALKSELAATRQDITKEEKALKVIEEDQARMRANMERVPPTSEAYKRYLKKFDDQETEIEKRREKIVQLQEAADKQRKTYEDFLMGLKVE